MVGSDDFFASDRVCPTGEAPTRFQYDGNCCVTPACDHLLYDGVTKARVASLPLVCFPPNGVYVGRCRRGCGSTMDGNRFSQTCNLYFNSSCRCCSVDGVASLPSQSMGWKRSRMAPSASGTVYLGWIGDRSSLSRDEWIFGGMGVQPKL